jgi:hypothetical protein
MAQGNVQDRNAGFAAGQAQVWGFSKATGIDSRSYFAPGAKIFYVDPNNTQATDAGNLGEDPTVPLATIDAAVTLTRDHMGDTIVVGGNDDWQYAPGNRNTPVLESVVIPYTKGGIRIVGGASNPMGVVWSPAANGDAALTIHAIDVLVEGFNFYTTNTNCIGVLIEWDGPPNFGESATVRNCFFSDALDYGIQGDWSWYNQIYNNHFDNVAVAAIHNLSVNGDMDYNMIYNNSFWWCALALDLGASDNCFIHGNRIMGDNGGAANYISVTGGESLVSDNWLGCSLAEYAVPNTCIGAASDAWVNNHCIDGDTVANP